MFVVIFFVIQNVLVFFLFLQENVVACIAHSMSTNNIRFDVVIRKKKINLDTPLINKNAGKNKKKAATKNNLSA